MTSKKIKLKVLMLENGVTPEDVARLMERSISTIYKWCANNGQQPPDSAIVELQAILAQKATG